MKPPPFFAHARPSDPEENWQLLIEHLTNTANLAKELGADAGIQDLAYITGLLHDLGKYSSSFQDRLHGATKKVDHSTAGARTAVKTFTKTDKEKWLATIMAYCIAGHHTGLPNYGSVIDLGNTGTLCVRLDEHKTPLEDFSYYINEIDLTKIVPISKSLRTSNPSFSLAFMTRMLFSVLTDADFQETETFMNNGKKPRGGYESIEELCKRFNAATRKFENPTNQINKKRTETFITCKNNAGLEQGFFTLTVPTGGGKTLASMAFALNHAVKNGLKRVIYVIPFTSIIEQNAAVFKEYLGESNVLEHHSNFDWKPEDSLDTNLIEDSTKNALDKLKLASENWDIPIIVTTNVQFFESLFGNKSSRCRKLHNMAKSVIIFDEAQMLPREYLNSCMLAIKELVINYGVSTVFCTATQPVLNRFFEGIDFRELAPNPQELFEFYKHVEFENLGEKSDDQLIKKLSANSQVLCIVNTRRHAKGLFDMLKGEGNYHLSTLMCPAHRKTVLEVVKKRLSSGQICRVISTQVMEAGIDVDFPTGYRAAAGLDSIFQAAGRVNREMKRGNSTLYIFDPVTTFIKKTPKYVDQGASLTRMIMKKYAGHPIDLMAIEEYFNSLYSIQGKNAFDIKGILRCFENDLEFDFKTAAENFKLIENDTVSVIIPFNKHAEKLLNQAENHPYPFSLARALQIYTVNIYPNEFESLCNTGAIIKINDTFHSINVESLCDWYNPNTGLVLPESTGGNALFYD